MLRPFFVAAGPPLVSSIVTPHGNWNVRNVKKHMAIRAGEAVESRRRYVGVKTVLEFVPKSVGKNSKQAGKKRGLDLDDTTADCWIMVQYHNLREEGLAEDIKFVIEEETSLCRVFHIGGILQDIKRRFNINSESQEQMACRSEGVSLMELDMYSDFENALNGSEDPSRRKLEKSQAEDNTMKLFEDLYIQHRLSSGCEEELAPSESGDDAPPARSPADRKSDVWKYFGKIQQKQKDDIDIQFAACHECGEMLKAGSKKIGTSSLSRHRDAHLKKNAQGGQKKKSSSTTPRTRLPAR